MGVAAAVAQLEVSAEQPLQAGGIMASDGQAAAFFRTIRGEGTDDRHSANRKR